MPWRFGGSDFNDVNPHCLGSSSKVVELVTNAEDCYRISAFVEVTPRLERASLLRPFATLGGRHGETGVLQLALEWFVLIQTRIYARTILDVDGPAQQCYDSLWTTRRCRR